MVPYHTIAVRKITSEDEGNPYGKGAKKPLFENQTMDLRETAQQNWLKIIYSLTYRICTSQVDILKMQLKLNCLLGLAVWVLFT